MMWIIYSLIHDSLREECVYLEDTVVQQPSGLGPSHTALPGFVHLLSKPAARFHVECDVFIYSAGASLS